MTGTRPSRAHASSVLGFTVSNPPACRASRSSSSDPHHSVLRRGDGRGVSAAETVASLEILVAHAVALT
jgi:hypothetical protein